MITNADTGVLLTWRLAHDQYMAITNGTSAALVSAPVLPDQLEAAVPTVQAQDGSFVGTAVVGTTGADSTSMMAFDANGNVRWTVPNENPQIALEDGSVIGASGTIYDQHGIAVGQTGALPVYSWPLNAYQLGSVKQFFSKLWSVAKSFWPFKGGNASGNNTAVQQPWYAPLKSCPGTSTPCPQEAVMSALNSLRTFVRSGCAGCNLWVFNKLSGADPNGFPSYLSRAPRFWDGTRSYAPTNVAFCPSGFFHSLGCQYGNELVPHWLIRTESNAGSQTPSDKNKGMQIFFDPATAICNVLSVANPSFDDQGVLTQGLLFHEALHGYTGKQDVELLTAFGLTAPGPSQQITWYIEGKVIPGGAQGALECRN